MKKFMQELKELWNGCDKKAVVSILYITVILTLYCYFGIQDFFLKTFPETENIDYWMYIYHNFTPLFFFFALGLLFVKFGLKENLKDYGLGLGDYKLGLKISLCLTPLFIISGLTAAFDGEMNQMYPLARDVIYASGGYVLLYFVSYFAYYVGWEFLFRGIGINAISKKSGAFMAIAVTTLISALIHTSIAGFGKPFTETFSAIFAGIIFGYVAYKTKSIWYTLWMHMVVGFSEDIFIIIFTRAGII